ncbi:3-carboxy-cis-cis-mucoante lactonizing enzyme [Apiospora phragmitis]|uniref:3-carboxy-cis-cis-mucoante lactonizing enzyme n=1 Tax=Apiospora phragmitis TaxID=2905665 RepID=A0ABR1T4Y4_9PEZI
MRSSTGFLLASGLASQALAAKLIASHFSGPVYTLDLTLANATSGTLKVTGQTSGCGRIPSWITIDKASNSVYCFDESWYGSGVLAQFAADDEAILTPKASAPTLGNSVFGALYGGDDDKSFVITAEYSPSTITTYKLPLSASSKPVQKLSWTMAQPGPRPDRQDKPHPHGAFLDPTKTFLVVPDLGADLTRIFKINKATGELTACPTAASLPGDGPRHGEFLETEAGLRYYSLNEVASSVGMYNVTYGADGGCLALDLVQTLSTFGDRKGTTTEKAAELRIAGEYLYASNRNDQKFGKEQDSLAIFKLNKADGSMTFQELTNSYGYYPRPFQVNAAGTYVAIGGQTTANVAIVARDAATGKLGPLVANIDLPPRGTYGGEDGLSAVLWYE